MGKLWVSLDLGLYKMISSHSRRLEENSFPSMASSWNLLESYKISIGKLSLLRYFSSFIQQIFNEHKLCVRHLSRHWRNTSEQNTQNLCPLELTFYWGRQTINKIHK